MRSLKLLLLPLLLALLAGMIPPAAAAQSPTQPDYACADEIFDRIYGRLNGRKAASDETARADSVRQGLRAETEYFTKTRIQGTVMKKNQKTVP